MPKTEANTPPTLVRATTLSSLFGLSKSQVTPVSKEPLEIAKEVSEKGNKAVRMALRRFHDEIIIKKFLNTEENSAFLFKLLGVYPHFLGKAGISQQDHQTSIEVIGLLRKELEQIAKSFALYRGTIESSKVFKASSSILSERASDAKKSDDEFDCISTYLDMLNSLLLSDARFYIHIRRSLVMLEFHQSHGIKPHKEKKEEGRPISAFRKTVFPLIKAVSQCEEVKEEFVAGMTGVFDQFCASRNTRVIKTAGSLNPENSIDIPIGDIPFFLSHILLAMSEAKKELEKAKVKYSRAKVIEMDQEVQRGLQEKIVRIDRIISKINTIHAMLTLQNRNINDCAKFSNLDDIQEQLGFVPLKAVSLDSSALSEGPGLRELKVQYSRKVVESKRKSVIIERTNQVVDGLDRQARHKSLIAEQARALLKHARSRELNGSELKETVGDAADLALIPQIGNLIKVKDSRIATLEAQVESLTEMKALNKVEKCRFTFGEAVVGVVSYSLPLLMAGFGYALAEEFIKISVISAVVGSTPPGLLVLLGFAIGCLFTLLIKNYLLKRSQKRSNDAIEKRSTFMADNPAFCKQGDQETSPLLGDVETLSDGSVSRMSPSGD